MGAVKPGKHEEGRAIDARAQGQPQLGVGLVILVGLQHQEADAKRDGQPQPELQCATVILAQRVVGNRYRDT
ncbi:hypothetical protein D3C81_2121700 [compost metagenome]